MTLELQKGQPRLAEGVPSRPLDLYLEAVYQVESGRAQRIDLVTFVTDLDGSRHIYTPFAREAAESGFSDYGLSEDLTVLIEDITGDKDGRKELEAAIHQNDPDRVRRESHWDVLTWEFGTMRDLSLGIQIIADDRGERARTWYISRPHLGSRISLSQRVGNWFKGLRASPRYRDP